MDRNLVAPALGKIASGLYIATAILDDTPVGMLCSFVEQASFNPPMITIAISPDRRLAHALEENGKLGLNVLGDDNTALMRPFASSANEDPFADVNMTLSDEGLPRLTEALAFLACELRDSMAAGDHRVYLAEIIGGILQDAENTPMIRIRRNGFQY